MARTARRRGDTESVQQVVFDFYDGRLFRVTVDYDRKRTDGLTDADMIDAISSIYGSPAMPAAPRWQSAAVSHDDFGTRMALWGNGSSSVALYRRSTYAITFALVVTHEPVAALARAAAARAAVLDAREAPQREVDRLKKEADDRRTEEEKARLTNKPLFRP